MKVPSFNLMHRGERFAVSALWVTTSAVIVRMRGEGAK